MEELDDADTEPNQIVEDAGEVTGLYEGTRCPKCQKPNPLEMRRCDPPPDDALQWATCVVTVDWWWCPTEGVIATAERVFVERKIPRP